MNFTRLILCVGVCVCHTAIAENITLQQFLDKIHNTHPLISQEKLGADIERERQRGLLGGQDWVLSVAPSYHHTEANSPLGFSPDKSDTFTFDSSVAREYWDNGGRLTLGYDYGYSDQQFSSLANAIQQYTNGVTVQYKLPILKNKGGTLSRLDYELQQFNIDLVEIGALENQENFLAQIAERYIDWVLSVERLRIAESRFQLAQQEHRLVRRQLRAGLSARVDELRAKDSVINAEQSILNTRASWLAIKEELAAQINDPMLLQSHPDFDLYHYNRDMAQEDIDKVIGQYSRLLKAVDLQIARQNKQLRGFEEQKKPDLDLVVGGGLRSADQHLSEASSFDQPQYFIGLEFRYPLGQTSARSNINRSILQRRQLQEQRASITRQLAADLRSVQVQMLEIDKLLQLNSQQIKVAKLKTQEERKRYNQGRSELTFVIQSRDNERNIQLGYAANAAFYQKLLIRYRALTDRLLPES